MNLHRSRATIRRSSQRLIRFFEPKAMRDERLQINDFVLQQSDRSRPRVMVAIDEFEINLEIQVQCTR